MIKAVLFLALAAVALAQRGNWWQNLAGGAKFIDTVHGLRVQYDDTHDLVIFLGDNDCYLVAADADSQWDTLLGNTDALHTFTEEVYSQIESDMGVTSLTHTQAASEFHSRIEEWECRGKDVHKVAYSITN